MSFYSRLKVKLNKELTEKHLFALPRSYHIIGNVLVLKLKPELERKRKAVGKAILELLPYIKSVCLIRSIAGKKRKPRIEVIAGSGTEAIHREFGCRFATDVKELMWSKGNKAERERMFRAVKKGEVVVDMFAGIGYWSILIARHSCCKKIYAIDINPKAISYLEKNAFLNKVASKIEILKGDCRDFALPLEGIADRVIMGYIKNTIDFLPSGLKIAKKNGLIHYHDTVAEEDIGRLGRRLEKAAVGNGFKIKILNIRKIKSYAPKVYHVVADIQKQ